MSKSKPIGTPEIVSVAGSYADSTAGGGEFPAGMGSELVSSKELAALRQDAARIREATLEEFAVFMEESRERLTEIVGMTNRDRFLVRGALDILIAAARKESQRAALDAAMTHE